MVHGALQHLNYVNKLSTAYPQIVNNLFTSLWLVVWWASRAVYYRACTCPRPPDEVLTRQGGDGNSAPPSSTEGDTMHYELNYVDGDWSSVVGTMYEAMALYMGADMDHSYRMVDPEAKADADFKLPKGAVIWLSGRLFTDDQLGVLDGPMRYQAKPDPKCPKALAPRSELAKLTKRGRRAARKARRALKRAGIEVAVPVLAV